MSSLGFPVTVGHGALVGPIRVLIADDEPQLRENLVELLAHEDTVLIVGTAADADEAIELATQARPDIALVDVKMPAGGGARAAREIIRVSPRTRVIALSAFEDRPTVLDMLRAGAVGYLVKGTASDEIVGSIAKVMRGGTSLSTEVIGGIVQELTSHLRRDEIEEEQLERSRMEVTRFIRGDGFTMAFQPIVDLRSRKTVGMEALSRFHSLPMRSPKEWFAEAARLELGEELELAAIRKAMLGVPRMPPDTYLSVNASHRTAMSSELLEVLGSHAPRIVVEITEHEEVADYVELLRALTELRTHGIKIAIDDAGAGFSLRHTLEIAPNIVKVDISITRDIDKERARRALASALISFAEEMGITIVAEGIETKAELETLEGLGVRYGQGYHLAEPAPL